MVDYYGTQQIAFMDDLVTMINNNWHANFGTKPEIAKKYDRKVTGLGKALSEYILIYSDRESIEPFSLGVGVNPTKSWLHTMGATIEVGTNVSDTRLKQILLGVMHILKTNVTYTGYMTILPKGINPLSGEMRASFASIIDVEGKKYAPLTTV